MPPDARMWRSARRSSSAVETPGSRLSSTRASTSATIRPADRIFAISAFDLRVICISRPRAPRCAGAAMPAAASATSIAAATSSIPWQPVHGAQDAGGPVVLDDLGEGAQLLGHPGPDRVRLVVRALVQLGAVEVADARRRAAG